MDATEIMTIDDVARYLKLSRHSIYRLAQSGQIPARKILGRWRFHRNELDAWLGQGVGRQS